MKKKITSKIAQYLIKLTLNIILLKFICFLNFDCDFFFITLVKLKIVIKRALFLIQSFSPKKPRLYKPLQVWLSHKKVGPKVPKEKKNKTNHNNLQCDIALWFLCESKETSKIQCYSIINHFKPKKEAYGFYSLINLLAQKEAHHLNHSLSPKGGLSSSWFLDEVHLYCQESM